MVIAPLTLVGPAAKVLAESDQRPGTSRETRSTAVAIRLLVTGASSFLGKRSGRTRQGEVQKGCRLFTQRSMHHAFRMHIAQPCSGGRHGNGVFHCRTPNRVNADATHLECIHHTACTCTGKMPRAGRHAPCWHHSCVTAADRCRGSKGTQRLRRGHQGKALIRAGLPAHRGSAA